MRGAEGSQLRSESRCVLMDLERFRMGMRVPQHCLCQAKEKSQPIVIKTVKFSEDR